LTAQLLAAAKDKNTDSYLREKAMVTLYRVWATNHVCDLVPLLDDATPIIYDRAQPDNEWRICDRAADTIAGLLGWEERLLAYATAQQRDALLTRVKEWAKTTPP
jgi:hypothetical protein